MKQKFLIGAANLAFAFFAILPARAGSGQLTNIKICNNFPHAVHYAIAYQQVTDAWMTRGWLTIESNTCALFDSALRLPEFYYRAQSDDYRQNGHLVQESWSKGGNRSFCVDKNTYNTFNFWNADNQERCSEGSYLFQLFQYFSNSNSFTSDVDVSYTLTFNADGTTDINFDPLK